MGPSGRDPAELVHTIANCGVQRLARIAQIIAAPKAQKPRPRTQQASSQQRRQLVQVNVGEGQAVAELVQGSCRR